MLINPSLSRPLIDGPLLQKFITVPLPLLLAQDSSTHRLTTALPCRLIEAPQACSSITTLPAPPDTSQDPVLPQGEAVVLGVEAGAEVPISDTTELSEQPVSRPPPECLVYSKEVDWVAEDAIFADLCADVEDWELAVIRRLNEAVIVLNLPQEQGSPSLDSDSSSGSSTSSSSTNSPDPSTSSYSSSAATLLEVSTISSSILGKLHETTTDWDENPCQEFQAGHIPDDDELVDPLTDFDREGRFLRNITIPDFEPVAHGGFGVVWRGADRQGNAYAVKLITRISENEEMVRHEIEAMKRARGSQWTVELYHEEVSAGDFLLVMDWCAGGDLFDLWKNSGGFVLAEEAIYYTAQLLLGIHDLHTRGIVHRDIKFENVMLHDGRIKIIDLGLAVTFDHDTVSRRFEIFHILKSLKGDNFPLLHADHRNPHIVEGKCGTPGYFPPEVDEVERYSFGVDYYAMGIMLHAMITSDHPYYYCPRTKRYDFTELVLDPLDILNTVEMDFLVRVLAPNPRDRLSVRRMKVHPIFSDINWAELERGTFRHPAFW